MKAKQPKHIASNTPDRLLRIKIYNNKNIATIIVIVNIII